jgi:hypothetical protein
MSYNELDLATKEQLWKDPDWICPRCKTANKAVREKCRECAYIGGEVMIYEAAALEGCEMNGGRADEKQNRELLLGYSQSEWYEHCIAHGTSGDQVYSILRDWANKNDLVAAGLNELLLDLYPLTIANASMRAGEQRQFAKDVAGHIGKIRAHLRLKTEGGR